MINELRIGKTANFHGLKRPLSNAAVDELFRQIRASQPSASQNLLFHRRVQTRDARWSAISFLYDRSPSFFSEEAGVRERICGFVLLVEYRNHVAVFKSKLVLPAGFATRFLGRVFVERVDKAIARHEAVFEKIRLRNMSVSKDAMRNKTFEANDLRNVVGPAGASRYVPQSYAVRTEGYHYSATPSTGRIAQRSDRVDRLALVDYAKEVIDELIDASGAPAAFIRTFARAIDLASINGVVRPTTFAIDTAGLAGILHERSEIRLVRKELGRYRYAALSKSEIDTVLAELGTVLAVSDAGKFLREGGPKVGEIVVNRSRIKLREFLRYLRTNPLLANVVDEKGSFTPAHVAFDANSTFGVVEASIAEGDEVLVCDDLGNEWADFIGISNARVRHG